jgi:glucosylglycerate synthase
VELDAIPGETLEQIERIGTTDLVVGVLRSDPEGDAGGAARMVREAVGRLSGEARAVVIHNNGASGGSPGSNGSEQQDGVVVLSWSFSNPQLPDQAQSTMSDAYDVVFAAGGRLSARACGVIASDLRAVTAQWIYRLVEPSLERGFDLVTPRYAGHKFEGLLNKSIIAPLNRALYGARIQNPLGPDFGLSGKLVGHILKRESMARAGQRIPAVASMTADAIAAGLQVCEANTGVRLQLASDSPNLSSAMAEILGPLFLAMERDAASWQRVRGSQAVPLFGEPVPPPAETGSTDVRRMIESFQLGVQNLQDVWSVVLPPRAMLETARLARLPPDRFRMPDELWVSIVYDFVLGHHVRSISRDHLLRSLTPLYLGWVASYALEMEAAGPEAVESRLERLSRAYEAGKTYLMSQWRWPDRFNP